MTCAWMAVIILADGFKPEELPQVYQPPGPVTLAPARRQARYEKWRFAGTVVTLNPAGLKVKGAILTLTPHSDSSIGNLKSTEKLEMFAWNVEEQAWEYAPGSSARTGTVSATLSHFSAYVPVITELGNPVVVPGPGAPPPDKPKSRGITDGEIAAAVIVPLLAVAAACFALYWLFCKRQKRPVSPGPAIESMIGFDDTVPAPAPAPAPAGVAAAPPVPASPRQDTSGEPVAMLELPPVLLDQWYKCTGCESPIKSSWPRCPTCRTENKGSGEPVDITLSMEVATAKRELVLDCLQKPQVASVIVQTPAWILYSTPNVLV